MQMTSTLDVHPMLNIGCFRTFCWKLPIEVKIIGCGRSNATISIELSDYFYTVDDWETSGKKSIENLFSMPPGLL